MYHTLFDNIYTGMLISMYGHELISPTIERTNKQKTIGKKIHTNIIVSYTVICNIFVKILIEYQSQIHS